MSFRRCRSQTPGGHSGNSPSTKTNFEEHPSNRTLVRVLRLGGDRRRFFLVAVKHSGGVCEAQKHPAGPIVSRSPNSFVFNDFVGLDLFFLKHARKTHLACHEHRVLGYWIAACCCPSRLVGRNPEEYIHYGHTEGLASLWSNSNAASVLAYLRKK